MPVSARLAMWAGALDAHASFDDAIDAVTQGCLHMVVGLDAFAEATRRAPWDVSAPAGRAESSTDAPARLVVPLIHWRNRRARVRLVLPVPGDVRGAPTAGAFLAAAIQAGEGVVGGGLGLVPARLDGGGRPIVRWQAYSVDEPAPDALQIDDAEHELARATRETASLLAQAQLGGVRGVDASELARMRRVGDDFTFAPGFDPRAAGLVTRAERLEAMLDLAMRDSIGGAIDGKGVSLRAQALIELRTAVRRARLAGYNNGYTVPPRSR